MPPVRCSIAVEIEVTSSVTFMRVLVGVLGPRSTSESIQEPAWAQTPLVRRCGPGTAEVSSALLCYCFKYAISHMSFFSVRPSSRASSSRWDLVLLSRYAIDTRRAFLSFTLYGWPFRDAAHLVVQHVPGAALHIYVCAVFSPRTGRTRSHFLGIARRTLLLSAIAASLSRFASPAFVPRVQERKLLCRVAIHCLS